MRRGIKTNIKHRIYIYKVVRQLADDFFIALLLKPGVLQHTPMVAVQTLS